MTDMEREELGKISRQLLATLVGNERELFRRYDFLAGKLAVSMYQSGIHDGVERALRITALDAENSKIQCVADLRTETDNI